MSVKMLLQVTTQVVHREDVIWVDMLDITGVGINDLASFLEAAKRDFPGRQCRIIQVMET